MISYNIKTIIAAVSNNLLIVWREHPTRSPYAKTIRIGFGADPGIYNTIIAAASNNLMIVWKTTNQNIFLILERGRVLVLERFTLFFFFLGDLKHTILICFLNKRVKFFQKAKTKTPLKTKQNKIITQVCNSNKKIKRLQHHSSLHKNKSVHMDVFGN